MHRNIMSTKTISIKTAAYDRLRQRKKPRESFTDVINRLTEKKSLMEFAGILSDEDANRIEESIHKSRAESARRMSKISAELT